MWKWIKAWFDRRTRIARAAKIAKALKAFADSPYDDALAFVVTYLAPASATTVAGAKTALTTYVPEYCKILTLMDAADNSEITEENISNFTAEIKKMGKIIDQATLTTLIDKAFEDGKVKWSETKEILDECIEETEN